MFNLKFFFMRSRKKKKEYFMGVAWKLCKREEKRPVPSLFLFLSDFSSSPSRTFIIWFIGITFPILERIFQKKKGEREPSLCHVLTDVRTHSFQPSVCLSVCPSDILVFFLLLRFSSAGLFGWVNSSCVARSSVGPPSIELKRINFRIPINHSWASLANQPASAASSDLVSIAKRPIKFVCCYRLSK